MNGAALFGLLCRAAVTLCNIQRVKAVIHTDRLVQAFAHEVLLWLQELLLRRSDRFGRLPLQLPELLVVAPHVVVDGPGVFSDGFLLGRRILLRVRRTIVDVVLLASVVDKSGVVGSICLRCLLIVCSDQEGSKV